MFKGEDQIDKKISRLALATTVVYTLIALAWTGFVGWIAYKLLVHIEAL